MPAYHNLEHYLDTYIEAAGRIGDGPEALFSVLQPVAPAR
jgi:hypothetical protein